MTPENIEALTIALPIAFALCFGVFIGWKLRGREDDVSSEKAE